MNTVYHESAMAHSLNYYIQQYSKVTFVTVVSQLSIEIEKQQI